MPMSEARFLSIDAGLGLKIADYQTHAAIKLADALSAPDPAGMWQSVYEARDYLEQLETAFARGEYPPFDRWYHESWIRSRLSPSNPHRPYIQVRTFMASEGHGSLERARRP